MGRQKTPLDRYVLPSSTPLVTVPNASEIAKEFMELAFESVNLRFVEKSISMGHENLFHIFGNLLYFSS